jgi:predicted O-methyltransferase YrrM
LQKLVDLEIVIPLAQDYSEKMTSVEPDLLKEIAAFTRAGHAHPHMLSGRVQGRLLAFLSRMIRPEFILEIGTFTGYSALCLAEGLVAGGELHTLERSEADANLARSFFERSAFRDRIHLHHGEAVVLLQSLIKPWDLVFIDADKVHYKNYYEAVVPVLKPGGWIIADNVFFHGQVLEPVPKGKNAIAIQDFNAHVMQDKRVEQVMLTVRDGLTLIRKI